MFADDSSFTRALLKKYITLVRHKFTTLCSKYLDKETLSQVYSTLDSKFKSLNTFSFAEHKLNPTLIRNLSADIYIPEDVKKQEEKLIALR